MSAVDVMVVAVSAVVDEAQQDQKEVAVCDRPHRGRAKAPDSTFGASGRAVGWDGGSCAGALLRLAACATVEDGQKLDCQFFRA